MLVMCVLSEQMCDITVVIGFNGEITLMHDCKRVGQEKRGLEPQDCMVNLETNVRESMIHSKRGRVV